ncbi:hypothetical protein [Methylobacter svalbardensis]|uniref:hypothetical protein n=1 Tax=Methylobacter svalbardensis TaxID=3080016 RepID=UPI0030EE320A
MDMGLAAVFCYGAWELFCLYFHLYAVFVLRCFDGMEYCFDYRRLFTLVDARSVAQ